MTDNSAKKWFFQRLTSEAFLVFSVTYLVLFVLELLKEGVVSTYISLPHAGLALLLLGVLALAQVSPAKEIESKVGRKEIGVLLLLSVLVIFLIPLIVQVSWPLTVLLIFVTVATLWVGTFSLFDIE